MNVITGDKQKVDGFIIIIIIIIIIEGLSTTSVCCDNHSSQLSRATNNYTELTAMMPWALDIRRKVKVIRKAQGIMLDSPEKL